MENLVDIFSGDAFSVRTLTDSINIVPNQYGRVNELGIFAEKGIATNMAMIEFNNGVLSLIPSSARGSAAPKNKTGKRSAKPVSIPRFALDDLILPEDIQNVRAFGGANLQTPATVVNDRLVSLAKKHDITNEYLKCTALAGVVKDPNGDTLFDLFTDFGVTETEVNFALTTDATKVQSKVRDVVGPIEDALKGDTMSHVHALCSPLFFDALVSHPKVLEAYNYYQNVQNTVLAAAAPTANPLRNDVRRGFFWQGVYWEEYRGSAPYLDSAGASTTRKFIADNAARFFPVGTTDTFQNYYAPADWMETVNTIGLKRYAKVVPEIGGRHVEVLSQSCTMPLCLRPAVLVKGVKA